MPGAIPIPMFRELIQHCCYARIPCVLDIGARDPGDIRILVMLGSGQKRRLQAKVLEHSLDESWDLDLRKPERRRY